MALQIGMPVRVKTGGIIKPGVIYGEPDQFNPNGPFIAVADRNPTTNVVTWTATDGWTRDEALSGNGTWTPITINFEGAEL